MKISSLNIRKVEFIIAKLTQKNKDKKPPP